MCDSEVLGCEPVVLHIAFRLGLEALASVSSSGSERTREDPIFLGLPAEESVNKGWPGKSDVDDEYIYVSYARYRARLPAGA